VRLAHKPKARLDLPRVFLRSGVVCGRDQPTPIETAKKAKKKKVFFINTIPIQKDIYRSTKKKQTVIEQ